MLHKIHHSTVSSFNSFCLKQLTFSVHFFKNKLLPVLLFSFLFLSFCTTSSAQMKAKQKEDKIKIKGNDMKQKLDYPYTAQYSSNFVICNTAHSKLILDMWKDWDDNAVGRNADRIADTVIAFFPTGDSVKGKENFLSSAKQYRGMFSSVTSNVAE